VWADDEGVVEGRAGGSELWRVCIRDTAGEALGAGIALGGGVILTCAHVVAAAGDPPEVEVLVNFVGLAGSPSFRATVVPDCWAPPREDYSADVALLRLEPGAPEVLGAPLHRLPDPAHRTVRVFGFPNRHAHGVWALGTLAGPSGPADEWVQVDSQLPGQRVRRGFSGSGVIDDLTGAVVGMVVTEFTDENERLAWMIPIDTIVRYVGSVARWVGADLHLVPRPRIVITVGGPIAKGLDPLLGAVKTAFDTVGKTPDEVSRGIEGRLSTAGIDSEPTQSMKAPVTVALVGVDRSSQPEALLQEVVKPLLDSGTEVELQFSEEDSPGLGLVRQWLREEIVSRTGKLAARVDQAMATEAELREDAAKTARIVIPVREIRSTSDLDLEVRLLASAGSSFDPARVRRSLATVERRAERAVRVLEQNKVELDATRARYEELKGLLRSYNARAMNHGLLEDEQLSRLYRPAAQEIAAAPCSLPVAEQLVGLYVRAVRRRLNGETGEPR
jgi:hypothetical protein